MTPRRALVLILAPLLICAAALLYPWSTQPMAPTDRPIAEIKLRITDAVTDYHDRNRLFGREDLTSLNRRERMLDPKVHDESADYIVARAGEKFAADPGGVVLHYDHPQCPIVLPAGRQFKASFSGALIEQAELIFPLEPLPWEAMQAALRLMIEDIDKSGWRRSTGKYTPGQGVKDQITFDDFLNKTGPKWASVGFWQQCDNPDIKLYLQIRHYNSSASGSFTPPAVLSDPLPEDAEDRFLFRISIEAEYDSPLEREIRALRDARRMAETGDPQNRLPLSRWLEDPDWRPEGWDGDFVR